MTRPIKDKVGARPTYVCIPCRHTAKRGYTCPHCRRTMITFGRKWRVPKKTDDKGWREMEGMAARRPKDPVNRVPDALAAECRTFDEWKALGRCVRKGQRSKWRDLYGRPVFHESQTDALIRGSIQRGAKPDHFDPSGADDEDPYQDPWLFT